LRQACADRAGSGWCEYRRSSGFGQGLRALAQKERIYRRDATPYVPQLGDIAVIQRTSNGPHGHIEGYDGANWISDFVQREFWPGPKYRAEKPRFEIYRG
jgi:hypothetical protein